MDPASPQFPPPLAPPVRVHLTQFDPHPCSYLPNLEARSRGMFARAMAADVYEGFLNRGFRRSGNVIYQPTCLACRACKPIRIDVHSFAPSASQRRIQRRNADLQIHVNEPFLTIEKFDLYSRYLADQHSRAGESPTPESLEEFLYRSPTDSVEVEYRDAMGKLVGVGICDVTPNVLSSVYFFWEPSERRRSMGVFSALREIELSRLLGRQWYHLGYWIENSPTMHYKGALANHGLLSSDGQWLERARLSPEGSA